MFLERYGNSFEIKIQFYQKKRLMRRREFIDKLIKISEINDQLTSLRNVPLFCCRQSKINERFPRRDSRPQQPDPILQDAISLKKQEVFVYIDQKESRRIGSASKIRKEVVKEGVGKRLRTTPSSMSVRRGQIVSKAYESGNTIEGKERRWVYQNGQPRDNRYFQINAMQPQFQFIEPKKLIEKLIVTGKAGSSSKVIISHFPGKIKKHSLTQQNETASNNDQKTGRALYVSSILCKKEIEVNTNASVRSESIKKYESEKEDIRERSQKKEIERRYKIALRKEINQNYRKPFVPPPKITARSYIIYELKMKQQESSVLVSFNSKSCQEVASLTKIMTCVVVLEICRDYCVDKYIQEVEIGEMEANVGGTTASLQNGHIYTIDQLLYGLMLPSGNDASVALAVWGGRKILQKQKQGKDIVDKKQEEEIRFQSTISCCSSNGRSESKSSKMECYNRFIQQMNVKAKMLKMTKTNYANSHGLINSNNKSSAYDIAILCEYSMRNQTFRNIVHSRSYKGLIKVRNIAKRKSAEENYSDAQSCNENQYRHRPGNSVKKYSVATTEQKEDQLSKNGREKAIQWQNTHKLMQLRPKEYIGIKTGFTTAAGPCLASCISAQGREFVIVVLGCGRMSLRFKETQILKRWLYKHERIKKVKKGGEKEEIQLQKEDGVSQAKLSNILSELRAQKEIED